MSEPLATDVERALQHAVGEVNSVFSAPMSGDVDKTKKKKKKRQRDEAVGEPQQVNDKEKKRKKKRHHAVEERDNGNTPSSALPEQPPVMDAAATRESGSSTERPQKKSKKDKGKQVAPAEPFVDPAQALPPQYGYPPIYPAYAGHPSQFMPYPPPPFPPYPANPQDTQFHGQHPSPSGFFPPVPGMGIPLPPELALGGSAEDILRTLQDLDLSKIANVLKTLNDAAAASSSLGMQGMPGPSAFVPPLPPPPPPTSASSALGKRPATSDAILGRTQRKTADDTRKAQKKIDNAMLVPDTPPNAAHANLLATKWLNTTKLAELAETQGLVYKKGKFSAIEEEQLKNAIEHYRTKNELSYEQIHEMIFSKNDKRDQNFWSEITAAVPQRPIVAVYHHVRRTHHPLKARGKWMPSEDESLIQAVSDLGQQWEKVSQRVGRMAADCRDRYRNHLADRDKRAIGHWTKEEEEELTRIVTEMTVEQGKDMDNDVFWGVVAKRMGDRRGRQQCRIKWTDSLSKTYKSGGQKPRWSQRDAHILVHKIASLNVRDDTEIDWKVLPDESWNLWSAHILQRRWMTLKKSVRGWEDMTHQEIMDILTVKKADMPPSPHPHKRKQKRSAEVIAESEDGAAAGSE